MKKKMIFTLPLLVLSVIPHTTYASTQAVIPVEAKSPIDVSLVSGGQVIETKRIDGKDTFTIELEDTGRYAYELIGGDEKYDVDIYVEGNAETVIVYIGKEKMDTAVFNPPTETTTETSETSETTETSKTEETTTEITTTSQETTPAVPGTKKTGTVNTGDSNLLPVWIIIGAGAGAVIVTAIILKKKKG